MNAADPARTLASCLSHVCGETLTSYKTRTPAEQRIVAGKPNLEATFDIIIVLSVLLLSVSRVLPSCILRARGAFARPRGDPSPLAVLGVFSRVLSD